MSAKTMRALVGALTASTLVLASCSIPVREVADPGTQSVTQSGPQSGPQSGDAGSGSVVLNEEQVERIIGEIQEVLVESEVDNDAEILTERLVDPALAMRKGQFVRSEKTGTDLAPLELNVSVFSATVGNSFPRVLVVASEAAGDSPAEVFFLTQRDARSDYMLESWARLVGGTPVRGLSVREGSVVLEENASGLRLTPKETLETYVNFLNSPDNEEYQVFDDNVLYPRLKQELDALNEAIEVAGNVTLSAQEVDYPMVGVALDTGSALVSASFTYTNTYTKTVEGSTLELAGTPAEYLEDPVVQHAVTAKYLVTVFFLIPPEDSDEDISVVGAERVIESVTRDDGEDEE